MLAHIYHLYPRSGFVYLVKKSPLIYVTWPPLPRLQCAVLTDLSSRLHMCSYRSLLFSILFLRDLNLLVPELTSILSRGSERCENLLVLVVLNSLSVGIRWISVNALVFGRELRIYAFVFSKPRRILYVCLQSHSVKMNFNLTGHSVISFLSITNKM